MFVNVFLISINCKIYVYYLLYGRYYTFQNKHLGIQLYFWLFLVLIPANIRIRHEQKQREKEIVDFQDNPLHFIEVIF